MQLQGRNWRAGERLWPLYKWYNSGLFSPNCILPQFMIGHRSAGFDE